MERLPSYYELKYKASSKIFESADIQGLSQQEINEAEKAYEIILEKVKNGEDLDEGLLGGLISGGVGALAGPIIGKALCKALGINEKGTLGKLLTSRLVTAAIGYALAR